MRRYDCIAWKEEGRWTVHSPSVPGVYGLGTTKRRAEKDFRDALKELMEYLAARGLI